jgi:hypothetical protein
VEAKVVVSGGEPVLEPPGGAKAPASSGPDISPNTARGGPQTPEGGGPTKGGPLNLSEAAESAASRPGEGPPAGGGGVVVPAFGWAVFFFDFWAHDRENREDSDRFGYYTDMVGRFVIADPEKAAARLHRLGYTHVDMYFSGIDGLYESALVNFLVRHNGGATLRFSIDDHHIYRPLQSGMELVLHKYPKTGAVRPIEIGPMI